MSVSTDLRTRFTEARDFPLDPLPGARARRHRRGPPRAGRRAHRIGQDPRRRVRDRPRAGRGRQGLLHDAAQGAVEPEVRRSRAPARRRPGRTAHRRQLDQRRRADRGDDHRGAPQHDLRGVARARPARGRRARRGPLPPGPLPRAGVGRGDRAPRPCGPARVPLGDGLERRGGRGVDRDRAWPDRRGDRGAATGDARAPLPGGGAGSRPPAPAPDLHLRPRPAGPQPRGRAPRHPARRDRRRAAGTSVPAAHGCARRRAGRDDRPPRRRGHAAGHRVRVQPRRRATKRCNSASPRAFG